MILVGFFLLDALITSYSRRLTVMFIAAVAVEPVRIVLVASLSEPNKVGKKLACPEPRYLDS